jgi:hypothetical protein
MPSVAVDPHDSKHQRLVIAYLDYTLINPGYSSPTGYAGIGTQVSTDGGATWSNEVAVPLPLGFDEGAGSPIVQFNAQGQVFVSFMAATFKGKTSISFNGPGTVTFTYDGNQGCPLTYQSRTTTAAQVLENLAGITGLNTAGAVTVTGPDGGPFTVSFGKGIVGPTLLSVADGTGSATIQPGLASALTSGEFEDRGAPGITSNNGIFVCRSDDGGGSWNPPVAVDSPRMDVNDLPNTSLTCLTGSTATPTPTAARRYCLMIFPS